MARGILGSVLAIGTSNFIFLIWGGVTARINTADTDRPGVYRGVSRAEDPNLASGRLGYRWITVVLNRRADPLRRPAAGRARRAAHTGKERHRRQTPITNHLNNRTICGPRVAGCVESSRQCECHPLTEALPAELARYLTVSMSYWPVEVISLVAGAGLSPAPTRADSGDRPDTRRLIETRSKR